MAGMGLSHCVVPRRDAHGLRRDWPQGMGGGTFGSAGVPGGLPLGSEVSISLSGLPSLTHRASACQAHSGPIRGDGLEEARDPLCGGQCVWEGRSGRPLSSTRE